MNDYLLKIVMCQSAFHEIVKQMTDNKFNIDSSGGHGVPSNYASSNTSQQTVSTQLHSYPKVSLKKDLQTGSLVNERFELLGELSVLLRDVDHSNHFSSDKTN